MRRWRVVSIAVDSKAVPLCIELKREREILGLRVVGYSVSKCSNSCVFGANKFESSKKLVHDYYNENFANTNISFQSCLCPVIVALLRSLHDYVSGLSDF